MKTYTLGGGCFWCLDAVFRQLKGVATSVSGYAGGATDSPTYEAVCTGSTGHAEVVQVRFDETVLPNDIILDIFFAVHDPTTLNQQGNDVGTQYRSIMLYTSDEEKMAYAAALERAQKLWDDPIVTQVVSLDTFYEAEESHQDFFNKNPSQGYCMAIVAPKIIKTRAKFTRYLRT